jgi:hypothetical protein
VADIVESVPGQVFCVTLCPPRRGPPTARSLCRQRVAMRGFASKVAGYSEVAGCVLVQEDDEDAPHAHAIVTMRTELTLERATEIIDDLWVGSFLWDKPFEYAVHVQPPDPRRGGVRGWLNYMVKKFPWTTGTFFSKVAARGAVYEAARNIFAACEDADDPLRLRAAQEPVAPSLGFSPAILRRFMSMLPKDTHAVSCLVCGSVLEGRHGRPPRADKITCSPACRQALHRAREREVLRGAAVDTASGESWLSPWDTLLVGERAGGVIHQETRSQ